MPRKKSAVKQTNRKPSEMKSARPYPILGIDAAMAALPIYGGTAPTEEKTESPPEEKATTSSSNKSSSETNSSGGDSSSVETDPQAVADLVKQVETMNKTITTLTKENEKFNEDKKAEDRKSMGREEALSADLEDAQKTIVKMDQALRNQAVMNAINGFKDIEFHDTKFAMGKLDSEIFEQMEVDLANGTVTVSGIENDLRRIAKENEWAVKKKGSDHSNIPGNSPANVSPGGAKGRQQVRSSGGAPNGSGGDSSKATARKALAARFPVIMHGRSA